MTELHKRRSPILFASDEIPIQEAFDRMCSANVGSLVLHREGIIAGIVTERDVLRLWRKIPDPTFLAQPVRTIMTSPVVSLKIDELDQAAQKMKELKIRHLPIVNDKKELVGILSIRDVMLSLMQTQAAVAKKGRRPAARTLHIISPTVGLEITCRTILPPQWTIQVWRESEIVLSQEFLNKHTGEAHVFLIDLDGLAGQWKSLLKKFIGLLTEDKQPEIMIVWSEDRHKAADIEALISVSRRTHWYLYQRPIPIGQLTQDLRALA